MGWAIYAKYASLLEKQKNKRALIVLFYFGLFCCYNSNMAKQMENKIIANENRENPEVFLQSNHWRKFQEKVGRKTYSIQNENFCASIIEHILPIVKKYFYVPRGPILKVESLKLKVESRIEELVDLAKENNAGWIRIEPETNEILESIKENIKEKIVKSPHDMQPKEIFAINVAKSAEKLLSEMKPKTRYNIGLAKKKGVVIKSTEKMSTEEKEKIVDDFIKLTQEMASRNGIKTHPENYYRKMIKSFPSEKLRIYVAKFEEKIIAANLVLFDEKTAIYLHGASGNEHRNVMAPFLLQWQAILDSKENGCDLYNFGGVQTPDVKHQKHSDLVGVTNFKLGFSPKTKTIVFPGSYDIIINSRAYAIYRGLQRAKALLYSIRK